MLPQTTIWYAALIKYQVGRERAQKIFSGFRIAACFLG
jgi:hypothetical protein